MSNSIPISDGRFITTHYNEATDEMTLTIETPERQELMSVIIPMDEARELARWLIEGCAEDMDITPEKIIHSGRPELN
jgi:hypothetical protein